MFDFLKIATQLRALKDAVANSDWSGIETAILAMADIAGLKSDVSPVLAVIDALKTKDLVTVVAAIQQFLPVVVKYWTLIVPMMGGESASHLGATLENLAHQCEKRKS